jgi:DNA processing protein
MMSETEALLILSHVPQLKVRKWLDNHDSAVAALHALDREQWQNLDAWKKDLASIEKLGVCLYAFFDKQYPEGFKSLTDAPLLIYVKGVLPQNGKAVAMVGTRQCTLYGRGMAENFAAGCASVGYSVVSGLARGIDTAAHRGALKTGQTVAVIGSGLADIYPKENEALVEEIAKKGACLSELPMHAPPHKHHFPRRNRLVVALSQGVFLAEAPVKSGAMITMEMACTQKKSCFTIPGRADMETFRGNHFLIKSQKAKLVENWQEMLSLLQPGEEVCRSVLIQTSLFELDEEEEKLLASFSSAEISLDELAIKASLPIAKLNSLLMGLVLKQAIREFPGKLYIKVING